jgi:hypothetical protein
MAIILAFKLQTSSTTTGDSHYHNGFELREAQRSIQTDGGPARFSACFPRFQNYNQYLQIAQPAGACAEPVEASADENPNDYLGPRIVIRRSIILRTISTKPG